MQHCASRLDLIRWSRQLGGWVIVCGLMQGAWAIPSFDAVRSAYRPSDAQLLDRHGVVIQTVRIDEHVRRLPWTPLAQVSPALRAALLLSEDQRFYEHSGVDWQAVGSAAWGNLWNTRTRGASTITMQLAGLLEDDLHASAHGRTLTQKLNQTTLALRLDQGWQKDQILEAYLNLVTFRGELTGIGALSATVFDKYPSGLDRREAAIAAALVRAPNAPTGAVAQRACAILKSQQLPAECQGLADYVQAVLTRKSVARLDPATDLAPHLAHHLLTPGGPEVMRTTLDAGLQRMVRNTLYQQLAELHHRNVADGAVIVIDNDTGDVLAWVGSSGSLSRAREVDGVLALRQAGSTLKPFLYQIALEKRWLTAASILEDAPLDLSVGAGLYVPEDYEKDFKGLVSVRTALGSSLNVPAVRTLLIVTPERLRERLVALGLPLGKGADYYGYSLALGSAEVNLAALTNAYRTLATGGLYTAWRSRLSETRPEPVRVLEPQSTYIVADILSDRSARSLTFGIDNLLNTPFWSAVKTGTSKDMRDNWCVGFSRRYTVGVWVGNDSGAPMWDVSGVTGAAPVWRAVMKYLDDTAGSAPDQAGAPAPPAGLIHTHLRFEPAVEAERDEWFVPGTATERIVLAAPDRVAHSLISSPADHLTLALDPDIPAAAQHLTFRTAAASAHHLAWHLDGRRLGPADPLDWPLWPGPHLLELVDGHGLVLDRAHFEVRGAELRLNRPSRTGG